MKNQELNRQLQSINNLIKFTSETSKQSVELQSHWAKYICIIVSGFLENAIKEVYLDFVQKSSSKPVADYACSVISKIQNPKSTKFIETARQFKSSWAHDLENFLDDNGRGDAIDSIMSNRHLIAHGKSSGITIPRISDYLKKSVEVINFIENQCKK